MIEIDTPDFLNTIYELYRLHENDPKIAVGNYKSSQEIQFSDWIENCGFLLQLNLSKVA